MNVPQIPQQEFTDPSIVANTLVAMKKAINPGTVEQRIRALGEADVLMFGTVSVIAVGEGELPSEKPTLVERQVPLIALHERPILDSALEAPAIEVAIDPVESEPTRPRKGERAASDRGGR